MTSDRRSLGVVLAGAAAFSDLYAPQSILPQIAAAFGVSAHRAGWVITVTTLAVALIGPVAGALADAFGRKRLIAAGALAMVVPTTLAALAATFPELLARSRRPVDAADLLRGGRSHRRGMGRRRGAR